MFLYLFQMSLALGLTNPLSHRPCYTLCNYTTTKKEYTYTGPIKETCTECKMRPKGLVQCTLYIVQLHIKVPLPRCCAIPRKMSRIKKISKWIIFALLETAHGLFFMCSSAFKQNLTYFLAKSCLHRNSIMTNIKLLLTVRTGLADDTFLADYIYKEIYYIHCSLQTFPLPLWNMYPEKYSYM